MLLTLLYYVSRFRIHMRNLSQSILYKYQVNWLQVIVPFSNQALQPVQLATTRYVTISLSSQWVVAINFF